MMDYAKQASGISKRDRTRILYGQKYMSSILMVPVHLDALQVKSEEVVVEASADFSRLPYNDGAKDINSEIANISEEITSQPFQNENLRLKPGVHLHWALPDALTKGIQTPDGAAFPAAPNRWLVTRSGKNPSGQYEVDKQWVVESDYLYPEGVGDQAGSVNIPYPPDKAKDERQPYRYLGRNMPLSAWKESFPEAQYLEILTAVGYGEPTFAAFYPNCHSIFGFHDDDFPGDLPDGLRYDVAGWYSDTNSDYVAKFKTDFTADFKQRNNQKTPTPDELKAALMEQARWTFDAAGSAEFPDQTLCYARVTFGPQGNPGDGAADSDSGVSIAVGNTGTEALSAYLASLIVKEPPAANSPSPEKAKANLEDQLEAAQLSDHIEHRQLDVGPKFVEARHEKGFTAVPAGFLWQVTPDTQDRQADATNAGAQAQITLPITTAHLLHDLNLCQQEYDRSLDEIESMRRQLFSDWYKYQICAYPPEDARDEYPNIDEVKHYLEVKGVAPLKRKIEATGSIRIGLTGDKVVAATDGSSAGSLAVKLKNAIADLQQAVDDYNTNPEVQQANAVYKLKQVPAPRYWQPNEPVVLLAGPAIKRIVRHGEDGRLNEDGLLDCHVMEKAVARIAVVGDAILQKMNQLDPGQNGVKIGFSVRTEQPWHPFLLEWEVEVFPVESQCNHHPESGRYAPDFIAGNYNLAENSVDLSVKPGKGAITRAANVYTGVSILTPHAGVQLKASLEDYLQKQLLSDYCEARKIQQPEKPDDFFKSNLADILTWYKTTKCATNRPILCDIIRAYELLTSENFYTLAQSLGGFNDALLMHKQTLQLAVADPLGFSEYQSFAERVRDAVGASIRSAPEPEDDFNPIRNGALKIKHLRLVDTFGRYLDLKCDDVVTTEALKLAGAPDLIALPPRLAQPSRFNFRWLSASDDDQEMNDHPATTPICGWVLPNNLDNSLMIYDGDGKALGSVNRSARWESAPGSFPQLAASDIPNRHLKRMVKYILDQGSAFLNDFISAVDNALENIEPENYAQHPELALLMGRPLALVRASLNLELQGPPALHQGWEAFRHDLSRINRDTNDFDHVRFPVRIGEYRQFNDGLAGYWREEGEGYEGNSFYAPQTDLISHLNLKTHADDPMTFFQTVRSESQTLAMLIDPRGAVNATSGVAPCKAISIPPDQYASALRAIEITFLSAPILTDAGKINIALPEESGFKWSWLEVENGSWLEVSSMGTVNKKTFLDAFVNGEAIWSRMKEKGWIKEIDPTKAAVTPKDERTNPDLGTEMKDLLPAIEIILARSYIGKMGVGAVFAARQEIREGWLKLSET